MDRRGYCIYLYLVNRHHSKRHGDKRTNKMHEEYRAKEQYIIDEQTGYPICLECNEVLRYEDGYGGNYSEKVYKKRCSAGYGETMFDLNGGVKEWNHCLRSFYDNVQNEKQYLYGKGQEYADWLDSITPTFGELYGVKWNTFFLYADKRQEAEREREEIQEERNQFYELMEEYDLLTKGYEGLSAGAGGVGFSIMRRLREEWAKPASEHNDFMSLFFRVHGPPPPVSVCEGDMNYRPNLWHSLSRDRAWEPEAVGGDEDTPVRYHFFVDARIPETTGNESGAVTPVDYLSESESTARTRGQELRQKLEEIDTHLDFLRNDNWSVDPVECAERASRLMGMRVRVLQELSQLVGR